MDDIGSVTPAAAEITWEYCEMLYDRYILVSRQYTEAQVATDAAVQHADRYTVFGMVPWFYRDAYATAIAVADACYDTEHKIGKAADLAGMAWDVAIRRYSQKHPIPGVSC